MTFYLVFLKAPSFFPDSQECFERKGSSGGVFHDSACRLTSPPVPRTENLIGEGHTVTDGSLKSEMQSLWGE